MRELLDRSRHGDKAARDKLIYGNLRLVLSVIQRFTSRGENSGRPLSGRLHRADQGHRYFDRAPRGDVSYLRRADDFRRA